MKKIFISDTTDPLGQELRSWVLKSTGSDSFGKREESQKAAFILPQYLEPAGLYQGSVSDFILLLADDFVRSLDTKSVEEIFLILPQGKDHYPLLKELFENSGFKFTFIESDQLVRLGNKNSQFLRHRSVRSIQRMVFIPTKSVQWVGKEYFSWLTHFSSRIVQVYEDGDNHTFCLFHPCIKILELEKSSDLSNSEREVLYIKGGLLAAKGQGESRLEFREVLNKQYLLTILYDFKPALPWPIYLMTQAVIHFIVMSLFADHLRWIYLLQKKASQ
jgi:hypothetical protein